MERRMEGWKQEMNTRRKQITAKTGLIFLAIMLLLTFFSNTINNLALPKVSYEAPTRGALLKEVTGTGKVEAQIIRDLYVRTSMKVTEVWVEVGERVQAGQILMALDTTELQTWFQDEQDRYAQKKLYLQKLMEAITPANLLSLEKAIESARYEWEKAQKSYELNKRLYDLGGIAPNVLAEAEVNLERAALEYEIAKNNKEKTISDLEIEIESTKLDLAIAERKIAELAKELTMETITAPCTGIITELNYTAGLTANPTLPLYKIADLSGGFKFTATVKISAAEYLEPGDQAEIYLNSLDDRVLRGQLKRITDDQQEIGIRKTVEIELAEVGLIGGESGTVEFKKRIGSFETLVPNSALGQDNEGYFVYLLKKREGPLGQEFYVEKVYVSIGDSDHIKTAVLSGITAVDQIVAESDKPLMDGSRVMIAE